jgi:hypothetical protein
LILIFTFYKRNSYDKEVLTVLIFTSVLIVIQGFLWEFKLISLLSFLGFTIVIPYLALRIVGLKIFKLYANMMLVIAVYSSFLYFFQIISPSFEKYLFKLSEQAFDYSFDIYPRSILFYTVRDLPIDIYNISFLRNSGPFHEPGAYAVFLIFAIAINAIISKKLFSKINIFLIIVTLTTFSTAGYFSLFLLVILFILQKRKVTSPFIWVIGVSIILSLIISSIQNIDFLGSKTEEHLNEEMTMDLHNETTGRIYSVRKSLLNLYRYPLTGRGLVVIARKDISIEEDTGGYGFMSFFSNMGIVSSVLFLYFFLKGNKRISIYFTGADSFWLMLFFSLMINLFSQSFIQTPIFIMIFLVGYLSRYKTKHHEVLSRKNTVLTINK